LDLAVVRIVVCSLQLFWVLSYTGFYGALQEQAALDESYFEPLLLLNAFHLPFGWGFRPGWEVLQLLFIVNIVSGVLGLVGILTNLSMIVFAASSVYLQAFLYSFGDFHHPEAIMMVALSVLALSPSGRVLSVDAWLRNRTRPDAPPIETVQSEFAGCRSSCCSGFSL
jgi:hypothetical protein